MSFKNEKYVTDSDSVIHFSANTSQANEFSNISWCNSGVTASDVSNSQGISGWRIDSASSCSNCEDLGQSAPPVDTSIPNPYNLRVVGQN